MCEHSDRAAAPAACLDVLRGVRVEGVLLLPRGIVLADELQHRRDVLVPADDVPAALERRGGGLGRVW